jgi:hypothetical protein
MSEQGQISAKNLGSLALQDFCPRCFYLKLKLRFKLPFQIFPGIFSSIDSYSKKITWTYYKKLLYRLLNRIRIRRWVIFALNAADLKGAALFAHPANK